MKALVIASAALLALSTAVLAQATCSVCPELWGCYPLEGERIDVRETASLEIDSCSSSFVRHGWVGIPEEALAGRTGEEICNLMRQIFDFEFSVNNQAVPIQSFDVAIAEIDGVQRWTPTVYIQFPAGHFAVGVHILRAVFRITDAPCELYGCTDEMYDSGVWIIEDGKFSGVLETTITLSAL